jgi:hypothetical protein
VQEDDMASKQAQKMPDITSFLLHAGNDMASKQEQKMPDITSFLLHAGNDVDS